MKGLYRRASLELFDTQRHQSPGETLLKLLKVICCGFFWRQVKLSDDLYVLVAVTLTARILSGHVVNGHRHG